MKDNDKTQAQLIKELAQLRQRIAELEASGRKRNQLEEALRAEHDKAQHYLDIAEVILIVLNKKGEITLINRKGDQILGYKEGELLGKNWFTTCLPSHLRKKMKSGFQKLMGGKREITEFYENPALTKSGTERIIGWHNTLLKDAQGNNIGTLSSGEDITERKRAEEALRESEERYRVLFEEARDGIALADADTGILLDCNRALADLIGRNRAELIGQHQAILHPPSGNNTGLSSTFKKHLTNKEGQVLETQVLTMTGEIREVEIKANLLDLQGRKVLQGLFHDITERKKAEEALRESETRFRTLFEAIPDTVLVHDDEGTLLHINEIGAQQLEWSAKDLVGRNLREIVTPKDRASVADHVRETHKVGWSRFETTYVSRSGWQIAVDVNEHPIKFGKNKVILSVARDITERKKAEDALLREKKFSDAIMNSSPGLLFVIGDKGNTIQWNMNVEIVSGYSAKEIAKMNVLDFVSQEDKKIAAEAVQEALTTGQSSIEIDVLTKPGKKIPFFITGSRTKIENTICLVCTGMDITERKQAEEALRLSEEKYRDLVENINDIIYTTDERGIVTYIAPGIESLSGYAPSEIIGRSFSEFVYPEDIPSMMDKFQEVVSGHAEAHEYRMVTKSGDVRWARTSSSPFFKETRVIGLRGVMADITDLKLAEEALRESEQRYRGLFEGTAEGILVADLKSKRFLYANPAICRMLGYSEEELRNLSVGDIHPSESLERVISEFEAQARGEKSLAQTIPCLRKNGTIMYADIVTSKILIDNKECNVGFFTDITERKQAEEEVKRSYEQQRQALLATVSALATTVEMKDQYTAGHQPRVTQLACAIAEEMGLPAGQIEGIRMAASIHDIGKIVVPAEILNKPGPLAELQFEMIKMHPKAGYDILKGIQFPWPVAEIVQQHHERLDGSGYPQGLSGEEIMLEARILIAANVVEAMTAHRLYRAACSLEKALEEISQNKGKLYDRKVVDACVKLFTEKGFTFL